MNDLARHDLLWWIEREALDVAFRARCAREDLTPLDLAAAERLAARAGHLREYVDLYEMAPGVSVWRRAVREVLRWALR